MVCVLVSHFHSIIFMHSLQKRAEDSAESAPLIRYKESALRVANDTSLESTASVK